MNDWNRFVWEARAGSFRENRSLAMRCDNTIRHGPLVQPSQVYCTERLIIVIGKLLSLSPAVKFDKKLSYRRGTARRAVLVETMRYVAQTFVYVHLISPATDK